MGHRARHPGRPHFLDYARRLLEDFTPLAGDRNFGERVQDPANHFGKILLIP
jgi:acetyl-CoA carboxylase alpha subunit